MRLKSYKMVASILLKFLTLGWDISRTIWRIKVNDGSFFCSFHAFSFELNLFFDWSFPLTSTGTNGERFHVLGELTIIMKTKTFTVLVNQRLCLCHRMRKRNQKTIAKTKVDKGDIPKNLFCFHFNFCLRNGTELGIDSNCR